ncbi:MAG: MgtC/SapB family protein [Oscillospiraceae bacterium]|nr:MgtC/SapB family protein [Oscillospiraceae bacterium]MBR5722098.1 MgtC/SapB family protein [Oscillospiraceae bacterium]
MLHFFDSLRDITLLSVLVRMLLAVVCGAGIGLERSYKNRPAGFRTHILVCIGATAASMTGIYLAVNRQFPTDLSRLGAQVVSGLGFIGGGTIIVTKKKSIKGLTTAAGLWACGIIGLALGAGFYEGGILAAATVLLIEIYGSDLGSRIRRLPEFHISLRYQDKEVLDNMLRFCKDNRFAIRNLQIRGTYDEAQPVYIAMIDLRSRKFSTLDMLLDHARKLDGVLSIGEIEEP